ncbi:30S ribosomal protein S5, partial [Candidatus Kaiserbacteria bacterium]|nr:30S ribosomal protein S5 [Candidatus Kaiserbacteria bacterium]
MTEITTQKDTTPIVAPVGEQVEKKGFKKNSRRIVRREDRTRSEFTQKIISIRRVTRVVSGGRR